MKRLRKIFLALVIFLVLVIGALAAIPFLFKDRLVESAKTLINENINATVDFSDVGLSVFKHFPNLTLSLKDLELTGVDEFEDVRLASADAIGLTLDLMSVIKGEELSIKNIELDQPDIHIVVLSDGKANYDIAKASTTSTATESNKAAPSGFKMALKDYAIKNGSFIYDDESLNTFVDAKGLNHGGSGAFTLSQYDLNTKTEIDQLSIDYGGISYLSKATTKLDAIFNIDQATNTYTLKDNNLIVNALQLIADGFIKMEGDDIEMDFKVNAPQNDFKNLLSLVPVAIPNETVLYL